MVKEIISRAVIILIVYYVLGSLLHLVYPEFKPQVAFAVGLAAGNMFITFLRLKFFPKQKSLL